MARPLPAPIAAFFHSRRLRLALWWALGLFVAYVAIGFLILPPVARSVMESQLGQALHRQVDIERVKTNPFTWTADVEGLTVHTAEGQELLGFDRLHLDAEAASLVEGGLVVRELRLEGPRLRVTRVSPERYDISDLIEEWSKPSDSPPPHFSISNIQVSGGRATLVDKPKGTTHEVADLALDVPFLSSLPYQTDIFVEPRFSAKVNGAPFVLTGRSKPFAESHDSELNIDLDRVELGRYLPYSPVRLPFTLRSGSLDTELKLVFRQNKAQPATLRLVGKAHVKNLALAEAGGQPLLAFKQLDVAVREADLLKRRFAVDSVRIAGLDARARIAANGELNWAQVADRLGSGGDSGKKSAPATWSVGEIRLEDGALRYQDQRTPDLPVQVIDRLDAKVGGLSSAAGSKLAVDVAARVNESGSLKARGDVRLQPLAASLEIETGGISILPFQPYFGEYLNIALVQGQLSGQGQLDLRMEDEGLAGGFKGQLTVGDLQSVTKADRADFLKWKSLFVGNIDARLRPLSLSAGEVALSDFYARVIVSPQGRLNLADIIRKPEGKKDGGSDQESVPVRIGKVSLQGGTVNFSDHFVKPNYTVNVTRIGGRITGLSSQPKATADLELRGNYGSHAPVEVRAKLNPFAAKAYLDLKGEIRGVDLTTLSTYSGKYAGYAIDEGKLSLYVTYHLENSQLTADNRVFLDRLTFGQRVDSPTATSLPVKLAIALLKNSRGEIDVNLPVAGSIDDPQFSLGGIITRVIGNLIVKVVTAPFAFLGNLFGGGEELSTVDFAPGRAALDPGAVKKLEALAKAMADRPALKLEITGRADPETDRDGLKRVAVERAVKAEKLKDQKKGAEAATVDSVAVSAQEYPVFLKRAYRDAKFPKPRNVIGLPKDLPVEEMEKLMLANLPVGEEELQQLADRRAETVQGWLLEQGKVPGERLFILAPKIARAGADDKASPSRVDFSLR
ncbi:MAG TPA: DUF748 domain-containing protein [Rhodocyclaceae bacterium]|nr:DUF748 domain-containing protein [Rhodocyclaceae bacterium]